MSTMKLSFAAQQWRARLAIGLVAALTLAACDDEPTGIPPKGVPDASADQVKSNARDMSPHREGHVKTKSATLHYLDWGGKGPALVLIPGLGDNAHIYDDIAPKLTSRYHVIAITRRGYGQSSRPTSGYDVNTLVADDIAVLDHLKLDRVYLAGHSIAGNELTRLAVLYPSRVVRLVYLDAAADRTEGLNARTGATMAAAAEQDDILNPPQPGEADLASFDALVQYEKTITRGPWTSAVENNLWYAVSMDRAGHVTGFSTSDEINALMTSESNVYRPEFGSLSMPALAIGALPGTIFDLFPWLPPTVGGDSLTTAQALQAQYRGQIQRNLAKFAAEAPFATTRFIDNTTHYLFVATQPQVLSALREFLPAVMPGK